MRAVALGILLITGACAPVPAIPESGRIDVAGFMSQLEGGERTWLAQDVISLLGPPVQRDSTEFQQVLVWYGLEVTISDSRIAKVAFTAARHTSPEGLRVGFAAAYVLQSLGPPLAQGEATFTYETEGGTRIQIYLDEGHVERVEWHYHSAQ